MNTWTWQRLVPGYQMLAVLLIAHTAYAEWERGYQPTGICYPDGFSSYITDLQVFDDGRGPALYAVGAFHTAGDVITHGIARWDGSQWSRVGSGFDEVENSGFSALAVHDDGDGPALYVGGYFKSAIANGIARMDGDAWVPLGSGLESTTVFPVQTLVMKSFDLGDGPALYVGGRFDLAGGLPASDIAKWDGSTWTPLGTSLFRVSSLAVADYGAGPTLFASDNSNVYEWDGSQWTNITGPAPEIFDGRGLTAFDDGTGDAVYTTSMGLLYKYDGTQWTALPAPPNEVPNLAFGLWGTLDDGIGSAIYGPIGANVAGQTGVRVAKWDGSAWTTLGAPIWSGPSDITFFDDGGGLALYVGGRIEAAETAGTSGIAKLSGGTWSFLSPGLGFHGNVYTLRLLDPGDGPALYAGGNFRSAGKVAALTVARMPEGASWQPFGYTDPFDPNEVFLDGYVFDFATFDDGGGQALYVGGQFNLINDPTISNIAKWDGAAWSPLQSGVQEAVRAFVIFDDGNGTALYVGGQFGNASGVAATRGIARWDGTSWSAVGDGLWGTVSAMVVYDDGGGPALYAGGDFTRIGSLTGLVVNRIAKWDGTTWSALGTGMNNRVESLTVVNECAGPVLVAGGRFTTAGAVSANRIARWDGSAWSAMGSGANGTVRAVASTGTCDEAILFAGGEFTSMNGCPANYVASYHGSRWTALGEGTDDIVTTLEAIDRGDGPELYVGGDFALAGGHPACRFAKWNARCPTSSATCPGSEPPVAYEILNNEPPEPAMEALRAGRFLTFSVPEVGCKAIRVTAQSLPAPYDSWNGASLWVAAPARVSELGGTLNPADAPADAPTFVAATLECTAEPHCRDWSTAGVVAVFHEMIVPGELATTTGPMRSTAFYDVQVVDCDAACDFAEEINFSPPLQMTTAGFGDTVKDCSLLPEPCTPPENAVNILDVTQILARFESASDAISKARAEQEGTTTNRGCIDLLINIGDVTRSLDAFQGGKYPDSPSAPDPCHSVCPNLFGGFCPLP